MSWNSVRGSIQWALMVALVLGVGGIAQAQNKSDDQIVRIGHADADQPNLPAPDDGSGSAQQPQAPQYWIGLLGSPIPPEHMLRAQVDLPENEGLLVQQIVPNSPASKAGLKQYDILVKANDKALHEMQDLVDQVAAEGPKKGEIKLDVLRRGKHETVTVTPEDRPANASSAMPRPNMLGGGFGAMPFGDPNDLLQQFRNIGPGVIVGGNGAAASSGLANMPNGVSVSVQKENDQPAHITVKRGNDTWNIVGDDPESLKQLPDDLRPFVEQMVHNGANIQMPKLQPGFGGPALDNGGMRERMQRMEQRLQEMQKQLNGPNQSNDNKSSDQPESNK
jgi:membrane-associated protease RseP (regulator of RpoE activity)